MTHLPTVAELDKLDYAHSQLMILRALCTSDLVYTYDLYPPSCIKSILAIAETTPLDALTDDERYEYDELMYQLRVYIDQTSHKYAFN